jgi:uncharacterized protein (TIGR02246 family)
MGPRMKRRAGRNPWLVSVAFAALGGAASAAPSDDESSIRRVQVLQADAWNRHEATAYAALFTEDGDCVNVVGWWWKGRGQIESKLKAAFAFVFHESQLTITDTAVRFLSPTIAIAHVSWTMTGAKTPPGMPEPRQGIEFQVLQKKSGHWLIQSFQNTNALPERPFPSGPPATRAKP